MIAAETVTRLREAMHVIAARRGDFTLFGIFMRLNSPGTFDLVVSAPWLDKGKLKAAGDLANLLTEILGEGALQQFARIETLEEEDPALKDFLSAFFVDDGEVRVQRSNLFGLEMEDAVIMRAVRAA